MIFIDESGSITRSKSHKQRYFVIAIIESEKTLQARRIFRNSKKHFLKEHTSQKYKELDYRHEIKGSTMPPEMKKFIFSELKKKTDIKFHYIIIDNHYLNDNFLNNIELCFNFVLENYIENLLKINRQDKISIKLDERNCSVKSLNSLEAYLKTRLMLEKNLISDFGGCKYVDSTKSDLVQISDMVANTVYRACKTDSDNSINAKIMKDFFDDGNMYFPNRANNLKCFSHNIYNFIDNGR